MGSLPQSPTKFRPRSRDTGFPEPFCGTGNTTLPHPDADTSPNASISADDISINKLLTRTRHSFLSKNHRRTISYGMITPEMERMHGGLSALHDKDEAAAAAAEKHQQQQPVGRSSKDGSDSTHRTDTSADGDDESPVAPRDVESPAAPSPSPKLEKPDPERRRSVLRKLRVHH